MLNIRTARTLCTLSALLAGAFSTNVLAGSQQDRMKSCNAEAKQQSLKGDERKAFMQSCLSSSSEAKAQTVADTGSSGNNKK